MSLLQSIFLGLVQGLTEFLPVSSSGHLALFQDLFHIQTSNSLLYDVLLHVGTLIAVVAVFYRDILHLIKELVCIIIDGIYNFFMLFGGKRSGGKKYRRIIRSSYRKFVIMIIVSTIPTAIIGYAARGFVESASQILFIPGIFLFVTAVLLLICDFTKDGGKKLKNASLGNAFIIGICQGIATFPGISRSGMTITACALSGFDRRLAVKYSFIMSIPAILGAMVMELRGMASSASGGSQIAIYIVGMVVAAFVGYICIQIMLTVVRRRQFKFFALYCVAIGIVCICGYRFIS